ncbi:MAG: DEAD/DEAH box helicase family protein [Lachnospiraceae bacterium]|nr:DEAD/DEAH box helicase family protein [Lachnospiraceae bacterium]
MEITDKNIKVAEYYELREQTEKDPITLLFYAIMHRRWDKVLLLINDNKYTWSNIKKWVFSSYKSITIEYCFRFNLRFLKSDRNKWIYDEICNCLKDEFSDLQSLSEDLTYDDKKFYKDEAGEGFSANEVFWNGKQPILDVHYIEKQTIPALQVMLNNCSMVLDEVGTGKTVTAIYAIQQLLNNSNNGDSVKILVVCPYNKREDWLTDIFRQLGRKSKVINQGDNGKIALMGTRRKGIPEIYICGNKGGSGDDSNNQLKETLHTYKGKRWDFVIIDECHQCFAGYNEIKAEKVMFLTATPIVVNSNGTRIFDTYKDSMNTIIGGDYWNRKIPNEKQIDPIGTQTYNKNDIFTCHFKEDLFNVTINRQIEYVECERTENRQVWFNRLREDKDFFSAIFADQDDERLAAKMREVFTGEDFSVSAGENKKIQTLISIIRGEEPFTGYKEDSFIIFCVTTDTVNLIYDRVSGCASDKLMIGKFHSKTAEIKNHDVNKDTILLKLKDNIKRGNRSILITTGKSGGTGINLGEFTCVIHYELPFTSNELEQRFGRIERADDLIGLDEKKEIRNKMIFMINKSKDRESGFITNRMLWYAITKINIAVKYMPLRNTVLDSPETRKLIEGHIIDPFFIEIERFGSERLKKVINFALQSGNIEETIHSIPIPKEKLECFPEKDTYVRVNFILDNLPADLYKNDVDSLKNYREEYSKTHDELEKEYINLRDIIEWYLKIVDMIILFGGSGFDAEGTFSDSINSDILDKQADDSEEDVSENNNEEATKKINDRIGRVIDKLCKSEKPEALAEEEIKKIKESIDVISKKDEYTGVFYWDGEKIVNKTFI